MVKNKSAILSWVLLVILARPRKVSAETFGNFLDVSWRLPEPKGAPRSACERDIQDMYAGLRNMTLWAYEMWDASARAPSGALYGSQFHLGNFDQCLERVRSDDGSEGLHRQYCQVVVNMKPVPHRVYPLEVQPNGSVYNQIYNPGRFAVFGKNLAYWGICIPASCGPSEVTTILQTHFHDESVRIAEQSDAVRHEFQAYIPPNGCQKADDPRPVTHGAVAFFILLGTLLATVALATMYHYVRQLNSKKGDDCPHAVLAFSLITNLKKLAQKEMSSELRILNGLRVISIVFVVLSHRFIRNMAGPISNRGTLEKNHSHIAIMLMTHGDLVMETFLLMSGLLVAYRLLQGKTKEPLPVRGLVLYRYIRLCPAYAMVILFVSHVLPLFGSGPLWHFLIDIEVETCRANWWANLLMINNYVNTEQMCMIPSWYMSCDIHFFLISLGVIWLLRSRPRNWSGLVCLGALLLVSILIPGFITYYHRLPATLVMNGQLLNNLRYDRAFQTLYIKSHNRASSYLIGLVTGYFLVKHYRPGKQLISTRWSILVSAASVVVLFCVMSIRVLLYSPIRPYDALEAALFASLHRAVWSIAVSLLIACCILGNVPAVSGFLGWSFFTPFARLAYGVYLTHLTVQIMEMSIIRSPRFIEPLEMFYLATADLVASLFASLVLYLIVEAPLIKLIFVRNVTRNAENVTNSFNTQDPGASQITNKFDEQIKNDGRPGLRHR